jgi:hypothetical protein
MHVEIRGEDLLWLYAAWGPSLVKQWGAEAGRQLELQPWSPREKLGGMTQLGVTGTTEGA